MGLNFGEGEDKEKYELVLENYEKILRTFPSNDDNIEDRNNNQIFNPMPTIKEAICIANIIKINLNFLGNTNYKRLYKLCERCEFITQNYEEEKKKEWYIEFEKLFRNIKSTYNTIQENLERKKEEIKKKYKEIFDLIENKYNKKINNFEFIKFILEKYPYDDYEKDKQKKRDLFSQESQELLQFLMAKYHPDNYNNNDDNEESQLKFCIIEVIDSYLNNMFNNN